MNANGNTRAQRDPRDEAEAPRAARQEVLRPTAPLDEQTLAVDLARADIEQQIATAHRFPRSIDVVVKKIGTMALYNEEAAESCIYSLPRAGKPIIGPSIGFANIVAQAWGNCREGARIVYVDRKEKTVVAEGAFLDLETNHQTIVPVNRRIVDKNGKIYSDDMILVTGMAAASIGRRNAVLNAVPRAIWHPIFLDALNIVRGTVETFAELKDKALKALAQFGVKPEQIFGVLGLKGEIELTFEHIPTIRGMYSALRDGSATVEEMFDPRRFRGMGFEQVENPLGEEDGTEAAGQRLAATQGAAAEASVAAPAGPAVVTPAANMRPGESVTITAGGPTEAQDAPPAAGVAEQGSAQNSQPAPGPAGGKPTPNANRAPAPLTGDDFATGDDYIEHVEAWMKAATSAAAVDNRYGEERKIRSRMADLGRLSDAQLVELQALRAKRKAELAK